ncbi:MAG: hypothetical protein ABH889_03070 [Candidatus Portnoybacteria bacterium]
MVDFEKRILLSITGEGSLDWSLKLKEINKLKIKKVAVFLERFNKKERDSLYHFLLKSSITEIPFVHLRDDITKEEIKFFVDNFKTRYFNIHEDHFKILDKWKGYWKKLYLEMNYDSKIVKDVKVRRIAGFCVDLSHFKASIVKGADEAYYIYSRKDRISFNCNHLNGYNPRKMEDKHIIDSLKDFDYLTTLPKYVFGELIALEVDNSIKDQIRFKKYLVKFLGDYFSKEK